MIEKIKNTFVGEDYIDLAIQHYHNCRKIMLPKNAYQNVLEFLNDDIEWFKNFTRDDIMKVYVKAGIHQTGISYIFKNKHSMKITKWSDGYEVIIYKPDSQILTSEWDLSFESARKMVEGWEYE